MQTLAQNVKTFNKTKKMKSFEAKTNKLTHWLTKQSS
jgi:hypothetical protein